VLNLGGDEGRINRAWILVCLLAQENVVYYVQLRCLPQAHSFFNPIRDALPFGELGQTALFLSN
jgi:hypothetical protein